MPASSLTSQAEAILADFAMQSGGVTALPYIAIRDAINSSPSLAAWLNGAAIPSSGFLGFTYLSSGSGMDFNPSTARIEISSGYLANAQVTNSNLSAYSLDVMVQAIGHESGHADNAAHMVGFDSNWKSSLAPFEATITTNNDATSVLSSYITGHLNDEGRGDIWGWDDLVSRANSLGEPLTPLKSYADALFTSSGNARSGITVAADGTVADTVANESAAGKSQAPLHPSSVNDLTVTYSQFYAAGALNQLDVYTHGAAIKLDYTSLGLYKDAVGSNSQVDVDAAVVGQRLVEAGFRPTAATTLITDTVSHDITKFSGANSVTSVDAFHAGSSTAYAHEVLGASGFLSERDDFNDDGTIWQRDLHDPTSGFESTANFYSTGTYADLVSHYDNNAKAISLDTFDTSSGKLIEHVQYGSNGTLGGAVDTTIFSDGSRAVNVLNAAGNGDVESADFNAGAQHAWLVSTTNNDASTYNESFDTLNNLQTAGWYAADSTELQYETFTAGHLNSLERDLSSTAAEVWRYDAAGSLIEFSETGATSMDWLKTSDGSWVDATSGSHSVGLPGAIPQAVALLPTLNADSLLSQAGWYSPLAIHSIDAFHM